MFKHLMIFLGAVFSGAFTVVSLAKDLELNPAPFWCILVDWAINPQNHMVGIVIALFCFVLLECAIAIIHISVTVSKGGRDLNWLERMMVRSVDWLRNSNGKTENQLGGNDEEKIAGVRGVGLDAVVTDERTNDGISCSHSFDKDWVMRCLAGQDILNGVDKSVLAEFVHNGELLECKQGSVLSRQGAKGEAAYFILQGSVKIVLGGAVIATRGVNNCVGEIPLIDPTKRRMADIVAAEELVALRITQKIFLGIMKNAKKSQPMILNMAKVLASRLGEHMRIRRKRNDIPCVFIGSSTEAENIAKGLRSKLECCGVKMRIISWQDTSVFKPSITTIENLESIIPQCDFAIMVLAGDDRISSRGVISGAPRDNVILELGMFIGVIGRKRSFFLVNSAKIPSDLAGATYIEYATKRKQPILDAAVERIVNVIKMEGVR